MLMFTSTFLTMMAIGGFPSFVEDMKAWDQTLSFCLTIKSIKNILNNFVIDDSFVTVDI